MLYSMLFVVWTRLCPSRCQSQAASVTGTPPAGPTGCRSGPSQPQGGGATVRGAPERGPECCGSGGGGFWTQALTPGTRVLGQPRQITANRVV